MITDKLIPLKFPKHNTIHFGQDMRYWEGVPSDVVFYPKEFNGDWVTFVGDGYGILKGNELGLSGTYGNGAIFVSLEQLPAEIQDKIFPLFKERIEQKRMDIEIDGITKKFKLLLKTDFELAKQLVNRLVAAQVSDTTMLNSNSTPDKLTNE